MSNSGRRQIVITKTALNYAEVMYDMDLSPDTINKTKRVCECPEFIDSISNPSISFDEKMKVIDRLFDSSISALFKVICKNNDTQILDSLFVAYEKVCNKNHSVLTGVLEYVQPVGDDKIENLKGVLKKEYNVKDVRLELRENKELYGGFKMVIEDKIYDKSVSGILERMRAALVRR